MILGILTLGDFKNHISDRNMVVRKELKLTLESNHSILTY